MQRQAGRKHSGGEGRGGDERTKRPGRGHAGGRGKGRCTGGRRLPAIGSEPARGRQHTTTASPLQVDWSSSGGRRDPGGWRQLARTGGRLGGTGYGQGQAQPGRSQDGMEVRAPGGCGAGGRRSGLWRWRAGGWGLRIGELLACCCAATAMRTDGRMGSRADGPARVTSGAFVGY
ncbi:glycine-rich cell wall structural protein 1.8-like [Phragmites australis]|uniref:glycine-rich cell wall structural protein 1.8-like n=1 Tax=Phragmites australis TaxID=29695 RepID=UPI002D78CE66|nr:glycine-rich cell wall structural protein 1.8-like [Phragmites australis]